MKITTLSLIALLSINSVFAEDLNTTTALSEETRSEISLSANMSLTSNYIWRGMTQTSDSAAIQGGFDLGYKGFYLGTWASNVSWTAQNESSLEADIYAGYAGELIGVGFDIGVIQYAYPKTSPSANFEEAYIGLSKDFEGFGFSAKYSFGLDEASDDLELTANAELFAGVGIEATYGDYDAVGTRYAIAFSKTLGKFDLSIGYYDFSSDASGNNEDNVVVSIGTSF